MKELVCISNYFCQDELTVGKLYNGIVDGDYVKLINDNGYKWEYYKNTYFKDYVDDQS